MSNLHPIKIGDASIGGDFGVATGLVVGSIFYDNHSVVTNAFCGEFNHSRAEALVDQVNRVSRRYAVQMAFDVIAASPEAMEKFLEFVGSRTKLPLLINSTDEEVRMAGLVAADRLGLLERSIYASLNEDTKAEELEALGRHRPAAVMVLAADIADTSPEGTCAMLENFYQPMLKEIGVKAPMVDLGTMDPPSIGLNIRQIQAVRERFGYPAGCAFSNCFPQWPGLKQMGREWINLSLATALVACRAAGADYLHYGIIEKASMAAHVAATAEVFYGFAAQELDRATLRQPHPLRNMFKLAEH